MSHLDLGFVLLWEITFFKMCPKDWLVLNFNLALREKYPYSELFRSAFSRIRTEYWQIHRISPYLFRMQGNTDLNNSEYGNFWCSVGCSISIVSMEILGSFTRVKNSSPNINRRAENSTRYNGVKFFSCNNHLFFIRIAYEGLKYQLVVVVWNFSTGWNLDCKNWLSLHWWWRWPKSFGKGINVMHLLCYLPWQINLTTFKEIFIILSRLKIMR